MTYEEKINKIADEIQSDTGIDVYIEERPKINGDYIVIEYSNNNELNADNKVYMWRSVFTITYGTIDRYKILDLDKYIYEKFAGSKTFEFDQDSERYNSIYEIELDL